VNLGGRKRRREREREREREGRRLAGWGLWTGNEYTLSTAKYLARPKPRQTDTK